MAFTKMGNFSFNHSGQPETLPYVAEDAQSKFDSRANELKAAFNRVVDLLNATADGASGADNVGMTPIAGLGTAASVQAQMESMKGLVDGKAASDDLSGLAGTGRTTETVKGNADDLAAHLAETMQDTDVTYTVGPGCDFETIQAALDSLRKTRITSNATVTISVVAGVHNHTAQVTVTHPNGDRIQIIGAAPITTTASAVGTITGGAGNYSVPITVASVAGMQVGQYAILRNTAGTGDHECLQGIWEITGIAGSVVTLKNTFRGAAFPAVTLTGGDFVVMTTTLKFTGCDGIVVDRAKLGLLNNVAVVGDGGNNGVLSATGASIICGPNVGATNYGTGFFAIDRAGITALGTASCGNTFAGYHSSMTSGMSVDNSIASGNVVVGITARWGSAVAAQDAIACGNLAGIHISNGSRGLADRAKIKQNKEQGIQSDYGSAMSAWEITSLQNGYLDIYCYEHSYLICRHYVGSPTSSPAFDTAGNNLSIITV